MSGDPPFVVSTRPQVIIPAYADANATHIAQRGVARGHAAGRLVRPKELVVEEKIRHAGVSNYAVEQMQALRRPGWIVVALVLIVAGAAACTATGRGGQASVYFRTLPPGATLPSSAYCAELVNSAPRPEDKSSNKPYNSRKGRHVSAKFLAADGSRAQKLARRINGDFTGTTIDILRWAACKWGINQDIVFAQAAVESWWQQDTLGGWTTDRAHCPPGDKPGREGKPGQCPQTYGILQNTYGPGGWPAIARSTAMNADAAYAVWRSCYDGYETWLDSMPRGGQYHKGDVWGCVGRWFSGQWRNPPALGYIGQVKQYMRQKIWLKPNFRF